MTFAQWEELVQFGLTAFVTMVVVVDPFGIVPVFSAMTRSMLPAERTTTLKRAVVVAFTIALFFLVAGQAVLSYLGITVQAFAISGGVLLFGTALPMLFGHRPGLQAPEPEEQAAPGDDIAVFPLAIPLLTGPGAIATILLLTSRAAGSPVHLGVLAAALALVYLTAGLCLRAGETVLARLGAGKVHIMTRVLGIILAALAVQFVLNGISGYAKSLMNP